ncbi:MAG TPA: nucleic acid-binding protein [Methanocorpusculum sp.]|nr:nucleic acid-binding protein [Methanocorpusculum sp.]HJJ56072.1 nucleic acid-binding protein [Methanocorpusculum sp.]
MFNNKLQYVREPAKHVFAAELKEVTKVIKNVNDEKAPSYVLLPTGERCNRVFIVGTLTQKDKFGDQNITYRARISDPTGIFFVTAGSYQPDAMHQLIKLDPEKPLFVAVVGKPNSYANSDGRILTSIRAESINIVDQNTRNLWVQDTARSTLDRIEALESPNSTSEDIIDARNTYGFKPDYWKQMVYNALNRTMNF